MTTSVGQREAQQQHNCRLYQAPQNPRQQSPQLLALPMHATQNSRSAQSPQHLNQDSSLTKGTEAALVTERFQTNNLAPNGQLQANVAVADGRDVSVDEDKRSTSGARLRGPLDYQNNTMHAELDTDGWHGLRQDNYAQGLDLWQNNAHSPSKTHDVDHQQLEWQSHDLQPDTNARDALTSSMMTPRNTWQHFLPEELSSMSDTEWKRRLDASIARTQNMRPLQHQWPLHQNNQRALTPRSKASASLVADPPLDDCFNDSSATPGISSPQEYCICVSNLSPTIRDEDLVAAFLRPPFYPSSHPVAIAVAAARHASGLHLSSAGQMAPPPFLSTKSAKVVTDAKGVSRGFGFVSFSDQQDYTRALIDMQGVIVTASGSRSHGQPIYVSAMSAKLATSDTGSTTGLGSRRSASPLSHNQDLRTPSPSPRSTSVGRDTQHSPARPWTPPRWTPTVATLPGFPTIPATGATGPVDVGLRNRATFGSNHGGPTSLANTHFTLGPSTLPSPSSALDPNNTTVFVGGLSSLISEDTLKTFFAPFGSIAYVKIPPGKGCGFVSFLRKIDAERAIERMQGFPVGGCRIRLSWGRSQGEKHQHLAQQQMLHLQNSGSLVNVSSGFRPEHSVKPAESYTRFGLDSNNMYDDDQSHWQAKALSKHGGREDPQRYYKDDVTTCATRPLDFDASRDVQKDYSHQELWANRSHRQPPALEASDSRLAASAPIFDYEAVKARRGDLSSSDAYDRSTDPLADFGHLKIDCQQGAQPTENEWSTHPDTSSLAAYRNYRLPQQRKESNSHVTPQVLRSNLFAWPETLQPTLNARHSLTSSSEPFEYSVWSSAPLPTEEEGDRTDGAAARFRQVGRPSNDTGGSTTTTSRPQHSPSSIQFPPSSPHRASTDRRFPAPQSYHDADDNERLRGFSPFSPVVSTEPLQGCAAESSSSVSVEALDGPVSRKRNNETQQ